MTRQYVSDKEASFLALMARRILNAHREAQQRGEEFNDLTRPLPLEGCGVRVKLLYVEVPGGYEPVVHVIPHPSYTREELETIASEITGRPMALDETTLPPEPLKPLVLTYKRKP